VNAGTCECGNPIIRKHRIGAPPKRCDECRQRLGSVGAKRGNRLDERGRSAVYDGPIITIRRMMAELPSDQRPGGVTLHVSCTAAAITATTGLPERIAAHIVEAMQALVEMGETGEDIRRRLNPVTFGRVPAGQIRPPRRGGMFDYLEEQEL